MDQHDSEEPELAKTPSSQHLSRFLHDRRDATSAPTHPAGARGEGLGDGEHIGRYSQLGEIARGGMGWGPVAAFLAMNYENVYIEMGVHKQIVDKEQRLHFLTVLETLEEIGRSEGFPHSISKKILYGSDWFMPIGNPVLSTIAAVTHLRSRSRLRAV